MPGTWTTLTKPAIGQALRKTLGDTIIDNLTFLYNRATGGGGNDVSNGSFENDVDADGVPDSWVFVSTGGTQSIATSAANTLHGAKAVQITATGAGGGHITTADYIPISEDIRLTLKFAMRGTASTIPARLDLIYYDVDKALVSTVTIWNSSTGNPTVWTYKTFLVPLPPAGSRFVKIRFYGANGAVSGSTWFDDLRVIPDDFNVVPRAMVDYATAGGYTFTVPDYISRVKVRCWGGGGGGGGGKSSAGSTVGGGGGSGGYAESIIAVVPGGSVFVTVGSAGTGGAAGFDGTTGGASAANIGGANLVQGNGGSPGTGAGASDGAGGAGGSSAAGQVGLTGETGDGQAGGRAPLLGATRGKGGKGGETLASGANGSAGYVIIEY